MKVPRLRVIYQPDGKTLEYAELGLNPYSSCSHDCRYCYNKRTDRPHGAYDQPRKDILKDIQHDLQILQAASDRRPVHISFIGDPYDMGRRDNDKPKGLAQFLGDDSSSDSFIRRILKTFRVYGQPFQILTKGGKLASKDFDLYGPNDKFGVTLTFDNDADSKRYEPGAAVPADRIDALKEAHSRNIRTWVSMEPVIDPAQTLNLIEMTYAFVDLFWVGKLNRHPNATWTPAPEWPAVDWPKFRSEVETLLQKCGKQLGTGYKLKHQLVEAR